MKLVTVRDKIRGVRDAWSRQYKGRDPDPVLRALQKLDLETASVDDVCRITGNDTWTVIRCDECRRLVEAVVQLGEEPDMGSSTAQVCAFCLSEALTMIVRPTITEET